MITLDDIETLIMSQFAANDFLTVFPGGVFFDRGPDTPVGWPFGCFQIKTNGPQLAFGGPYVQTFQVTISGYNPPESVVPPETTSTVQQFFHTAFATEAAVTALKALPLRNATERVMVCRPLPLTAEAANELREGRDIFISGIVLSIMCQGDRSLS